MNKRIINTLPVIGLKWLGESGFKNKRFSQTVPIPYAFLNANILAG